MIDSLFVQHFVKNALGYIKKIVGDRSGPIIDYLKDLEIHLQDDRGVGFSISPQDKIIHIGLQYFERVWVACYAFLVVVDEMLKTDQEMLAGIPDEERTSERATRGLWMLAWALSNEFEGHDYSQELPPFLPQPEVNPPVNTDAFGANCLLTNAVAYVLLHEFAHLYLGHHPQVGVPSMEQENEADRQAASWFLDGLGETDSHFKMRMIGLTAVSLLAIARELFCPESFRPRFEQRRHPRSYDRMYHLVDHYIENDRHFVWLFVSFGLTALVHARVSRINYTTGEFDQLGRPFLDKETPCETPKEHADFLIDAISRMQKTE